jgi:hypothetical protein
MLRRTSRSDLVHEAFEGDLPAGRELLLARLGLPVTGDLAGAGLVLDDLEGVAGVGDVLVTHDLDRVGGDGGPYRLAASVDHGADASVRRAGEESLALPE